jgi:hypothetical protein
MEGDSSQSLVISDRGPPQPAHLFKYQDRFIANLETYNSNEEQWLPAVCENSITQVDRLLDRWSRLRNFEEGLQDAQNKERARKRESQQPSVESDSEDGITSTPVPYRAGSVQPLFAEPSTFPIPISGKFRDAPSNPASSYGVSPGFERKYMPNSVPTSPRTSLGPSPTKAAAAIEAKDEDEDLDLEIPWTLRTRRHYWRYIDGTIQDTNTDLPTCEALLDDQSWTEISASWVCREALTEAGYSFSQFQKERQSNRQTKLESYFRIEGLTFEQVRRLVERTVEIYRKRHAPALLSRETTRRESFEGPCPTRAPPARDHDCTPLASQANRPPLAHSTTTIYAPHPPPLDRSISMPGPLPIQPQTPGSTNLHPQQPVSATLPVLPPYAPQPYSPQTSYPPPPSPAYQAQPSNSHFSQASTYSQQTLHNAHAHARSSRSSQDSYSSISESDFVDREKDRDRERKYRSRSRRPSDSQTKRGRGHGHSATTKTLMGVAGLTALLDGLIGI